MSPRNCIVCGRFSSTEKCDKCSPTHGFDEPDIWETSQHVSRNPPDQLEDLPEPQIPDIPEPDFDGIYAAHKATEDQAIDTVLGQMPNW